MRPNEGHTKVLGKKQGDFVRGDEVIVTDPDGGFFEGRLTSIMSTQIMVGEDSNAKFFFYKGLQMKHKGDS